MQGLIESEHKCFADCQLDPLRLAQPSQPKTPPNKPKAKAVAAAATTLMMQHFAPSGEFERDVFCQMRSDWEQCWAKMHVAEAVKPMALDKESEESEADKQEGGCSVHPCASMYPCARAEHFHSGKGFLFLLNAPSTGVTGCS